MHALKNGVLNVEDKPQANTLTEVAKRLIKWDTDFPVNGNNGYVGLKELDRIITDAKAALVAVGDTHVDEFGEQTPSPVSHVMGQNFETPTPPGNQIRTAECDGKDAMPVTGQLPVGMASPYPIVGAPTAEQERLRFEGDLDKWMKTIAAGITGSQPEAYAIMDLACAELVKLRAMLAFLNDNHALELVWQEVNGDPSECGWHLFRRFGGRSDRDFKIVGTGETVEEAIGHAMNDRAAIAAAEGNAHG